MNKGYFAIYKEENGETNYIAKSRKYVGTGFVTGKPLVAKDIPKLVALIHEASPDQVNVMQTKGLEGRTTYLEPSEVEIFNKEMELTYGPAKISKE